MDLIEHRGPQHKGCRRPARHAAGVLLGIFLLSGAAGYLLRARLRS